MTLSPTALEGAAKAVFEQSIYHGYNDEVKVREWTRTSDLHRTAAAAAITAYLAQMKREGSEMTPAATADLLRFVIDHYANQDMNHADFRVYAYQIAQRIVEPTDASSSAERG